MQNKILVVYTTNAGSTREAAEAVAGELCKGGAAVEVRQVDEVENLTPYNAVVLGGPMILGWHRGAVKFLKKHRQTLSQIPVAYFFTAMSLTKTGETHLDGVPLQIDPDLPKRPKNPNRLSFRERHTTVKNYLGPVLRSVPQIKPVSVGFFAGKMDYSRLRLFQMLFVMFIIQVQPGDRRNWPAIKKWAGTLPNLFGY